MSVGVTGIGGFFFRAKDAAALSAWYARHLGVGTGEWGEWQQAAGPSLFLPAGPDDDHLAADRTWRLNFRVEGLAELVADLRAAGIEVAADPDWYAPGVGRFARLHDPEGNPIELWEPD